MEQVLEVIKKTQRTIEMSRNYDALVTTAMKSTTAEADGLIKPAAVNNWQIKNTVGVKIKCGYYDAIPGNSVD